MFAQASDELRYVNVHLKSDQFCEEKYNSDGNIRFVKDAMICAYDSVSLKCIKAYQKITLFCI